MLWTNILGDGNYYFVLFMETKKTETKIHNSKKNWIENNTNKGYFLARLLGLPLAGAERFLLTGAGGVLSGAGGGATAIWACCW